MKTVALQRQPHPTRDDCDRKPGQDYHPNLGPDRPLRNVFFDPPGVVERFECAGGSIFEPSPATTMRLLPPLNNQSLHESADYAARITSSPATTAASKLR